jgi:hypothetical protein
MSDKLRTRLINRQALADVSDAGAIAPPSVQEVLREGLLPHFSRQRRAGAVQSYAHAPFVKTIFASSADHRLLAAEIGVVTTRQRSSALDIGAQ